MSPFQGQRCHIVRIYISGKFATYPSPSLCEQSELQCFAPITRPTKFVNSVNSLLRRRRPLLYFVVFRPNHAPQRNSLIRCYAVGSHYYISLFTAPPIIYFVVYRAPKIYPLAIQKRKTRRAARHTSFFDMDITI